VTNKKRIAMLAAITALAVAPALGAPTANATSINCMHAGGPIVGHPGDEYVCYVKHDDGSRETFYAPGPFVP
jgi:hypothetical protein